MVIEIRCLNTPYSYWSSRVDMWSRSIAIVVSAGLEPPAAGGIRRRRGIQVGAGRTLGSSGQGDNTDTWEDTKEKMSADCTGRTLEAAKDSKHQ